MMKSCAGLILGLLLCLPAGRLAAQSESFETAFARKVEQFCEAVEWIERDTYVTRPGKSMMRDNMSGALSEARSVAGFMENFSLEGLSEGHADQLRGIVARAMVCREKAFRVGGFWWGYFEAQWGLEPRDERRRSDWDATLKSIAAHAADRLAEGE